MKGCSLDTAPLGLTKSLNPEALGSLAGIWTGHLLGGDGIPVALAIDVRPDGQFDAAGGSVVKVRFRGRLAIPRPGELEFATRNAGGPATVHEDGSQRVLQDRARDCRRDAHPRINSHAASCHGA